MKEIKGNRTASIKKRHIEYESKVKYKRLESLREKKELQKVRKKLEDTIF